MWNKLRLYAVPSLILFLASLLFFSAAMPRFSIYLSILCALEGIYIILYRRTDNRQFFGRVLSIGAGNLLAYALEWLLLGRAIDASNLDPLELALLALLLAGTIYLVTGLSAKGPRRGSGDPSGSPGLLPERKYDLERLKGLLENGTPILGVDAQWGDGKTFLTDRLCAMDQIRDRYEIVRIHVLAGNEDEIELTLMNEFDQIFRRNRIFSVASKQMLKFLESSDVLKQFRWLLIEETQSVSATFLNVLSDLKKLDKKVLIIVDDIERLGSEALIRKVFALMESVSSENVQIVYLFNSPMLAGFDRNFLEKYIPIYINLTPIRFKSIVHALWDELKMDGTKAALSDTENMAEFPKLDYTIPHILALDPPGSFRSFRLNNITVRRVRVFLEEFRGLENLWETHAPFSAFPAANHELLLKGLFIKHFLHDDYKRIVPAVSLIDSFPFHLDERAKSIAARFSQPVPDDVTLPYLFNIRRQMDSDQDMQSLMSIILEDDGNYNRLLALAMLGFNFADIRNDLQHPRQAAAGAPRPANPHDRLILKAERLGNEDVSDIKRNRGNEQIDRILWNLVANGSSEWADLDAYVRHFQRTVLSVPPADQQAAWERFSSDAYNGSIYKNNTTLCRLGADPYLPLFQGFRVTGADAGQWMKLLDFYFRQERSRRISAEMLQNLIYVDLTDHRVYLALLKHVLSCGIAGNLNLEPCMYRFLTHTLRPAFSLGYTRSELFHSLWYLENDPSGARELAPSTQWEKAAMSIVEQFSHMKSALEREKERTPRLPWLHADIDVIIRFITKCEELSRAEKPLGMRTPRIEVTESTSTYHQERCDAFRKDLREGMEEGLWLERLHDAYDEGALDPLEIDALASLLDKDEHGGETGSANDGAPPAAPR